jgi:hypothetical protein
LPFAEISDGFKGKLFSNKGSPVQPVSDQSVPSGFGGDDYRDNSVFPQSGSLNFLRIVLFGVLMRCFLYVP